MASCNEIWKSTIQHRKWGKWLIFDSGCTGWQSMPKNLVNIDSPNLVSWLEESLRKEQKLCRGYSF